MRKITGGVLAALLMVLVFPTVAHASGTNVEDLTSPYDSQPDKTVTVTCPPGHTVRGMGGWTHPGGQILTSVTTNDSLSSVTVSARAQAGESRLWSVTARAVCGEPGPRRVVALGFGTGQATATCDAGELLYGSGFVLLGSDSSRYLTGIVPSAAVQSVTVMAEAPGPEPLAVAAVAICGPRLPQFARTQASTASDTSPAKQAVAGKPRMDVDIFSRIHGGGALINGDGAFIDGIGPNAALDGFKARAAKLARYPALPWLTARAAGDDDGEDWSLTTYGTCIGHWYAFEN